MSPTPTPTIPTPPPDPGNTAVIVGILDPALIPAAPGENPCPELCDTWDGGASSLANPPSSGWEYTKVIAEIDAAKGQHPAVSLDELLGTSNTATPSVIAGIVVGLVIVAAALAAFVRHRDTSPSVTAEEV